MASGRISMTPTFGHWAGEIVWSSKPIPDTNSSSVYAEVYVWRTDGGLSYGNNPYLGRVYIGSKWGELQRSRMTGSRKLAGSVSSTVNHNGNGDATVYISAKMSGSDNNDLHGSNLSGGKTVTLDHIVLAGPSTMTFTADKVKMGKKLGIAIARDSPDCTHSLTYSFGSISGTIANDVATSCEWLVPDLAGYCINHTEKVCKIECETFYKGKPIGSTSRDVTLTVQDASIPAADEDIITLGTSTNIGTHRNSGSFSVTLGYTFQNKYREIGSGKEESFAWELPYDLAKEIPLLTEATAELVCKTYNGTAFVGETKKTIKLVVPENETTKPKIQDITTSVISKLPEDFKGIYITGKTGVRVETKASGEYSPVAEYKVKVGNQATEGNPAVLDTIQGTGSLYVSVTVVDQRGFKRLDTRKIDVLPYVSPNVVNYTGENEVICSRSNSDGAITPDGVFLLLKVGKKTSSIMKDGVNINQGSLRFRWKDGTAQSFGPWIVLLDYDSPETETLQILPDVCTSLTKSYVIEIQVEDKLGASVTRSFKIMTMAISFTLFDGVDGAAFGKFSERPHCVEFAPQMTVEIQGGADHLIVGGKTLAQLIADAVAGK